jgi:CheY-like chemotaxis protein
LQQVFWNLLTNAVKFTSGGGRVDLRVDSEGDQVRISVSDTGCGIQPEFLPHVFERFRQGDGSSTRIHGGLGLGLSIVRHLVELHGGRMTAESSGEGMGSSFIVYLPTRQPEQLTPVQTTIPPPKKHHLDLRGVRVLVVDHDRDTRELVRAMLRGTGARVSEADSHEASTRTFVEDRPHVVLADLTAPGQEGYAVLRAIRSLPDGSGLQTPFIALTAYAGDEEAHRALKVGFDGHVAKPVQADDLLSAIEHVRTTVLAAVLTGNEQGAKVH